MSNTFIKYPNARENTSYFIKCVGSKLLKIIAIPHIVRICCIYRVGNINKVNQYHEVITISLIWTIF